MTAVILACLTSQEEHRGAGHPGIERVKQGVATGEKVGRVLGAIRGHLALGATEITYSCFSMFCNFVMGSKNIYSESTSLQRLNLSLFFFSWASKSDTNLSPDAGQ